MTTNNAKPAKPATTAKDSAKVKVEKWLNEQGYPLEYKTYWSLLRRFAGNCGLGAYVESRDGTPRELDVYACDNTFGHDWRFTSHLRLVCECKYLKKPWVLLYGNTTKSDVITEWMHTPRSTPLQWLPSPSDERPQEIVKELTKAFHFSEGAWLAHSIVQALNKGKDQDQAYGSLQKITHAAWDYIETWESHSSKKLYDMVFPCLVVRGPLFGAFFDPKTGHIHAKEIRIGRVCWQGCHNGTNVDVVHESALDEYADKVRDSFTAIVRVLLALYDP
jgi:hypothetical protein